MVYMSSKENAYRSHVKRIIDTGFDLENGYEIESMQEKFRYEFKVIHDYHF